MTEYQLFCTGIFLLVYSSSVMSHYAMAVYRPDLRAYVNPNLLGPLPTFISFIHIAVFWWLPIFLFIKLGFKGVLLWVVLLGIGGAATKLSGLVTLLGIHFWLATIASIIGITFTVLVL